MYKIVVSICIILALAATVSVGGVFATFDYAKSEAASENSSVGAQIGTFVYTKDLQQFLADVNKIIDCARGTSKYGLNRGNLAEDDEPSMSYLYKYDTSTLGKDGRRYQYGYVGTMDMNAVDGRNVYGEEEYSYMSIVMTRVLDANGRKQIFMYFVNKSNDELKSMAEGTVLDHVYRVSFYITRRGKYERFFQLAEGTSEIKLYEGQNDGSKTFGYYNNAEIWQAV